MTSPVGYWTMFGPGPDPTPAPDPTLISPALAAPAPVYHSVITGTFDPTPAEIVVAASAAGTPVPPGMDPVEFSRMMSGLPASPSSTWAPPSPTSSAPLPTFGGSLPPTISSMTPMPTAPTIGSFPAPPTLPPFSGISGSPSPSFDGGGGLLCDPITGKCPQYR